MEPKKGQCKPDLTAHCGFAHVFEQPKRKLAFGERPESEVVYSRSDYDGRKWWTTWWDCQPEKPAADLVQEIDRFQNALFAMPEFRTLDAMRRLCAGAQTTNDPTEFNLYAETEHFYIWLRLITRSRDYNLYVHYFLK